MQPDFSAASLGCHPSLMFGEGSNHVTSPSAADGGGTVGCSALLNELQPGPAITASDSSRTKLMLALHSPTGQVLAVKSVSSTALPREMRQLENERTSLERLRGSAHVVNILCALDSTDPSSTDSRGAPVRTLSLLLEYVAGGSLAGVLTHCGGALPELAARSYARGIVQGLADCHAAGLVHCDVRAANVLICKETQNAKLCSFGYSMRNGEAKRRVKKKQRLQGTYQWMAPEVMRQEDQTPASDVWSLGCTLLEMLTACPPWAAYTGKADSLIERVGYSGEAPPLPDNLPVSWRTVLLSCLDPEPARRPTAMQLLESGLL